MEGAGRPQWAQNVSDWLQHSSSCPREQAGTVVKENRSAWPQVVSEDWVHLFLCRRVLVVLGWSWSWLSLGGRCGAVTSCSFAFQTICNSQEDSKDCHPRHSLQLHCAQATVSVCKSFLLCKAFRPHHLVQQTSGNQWLKTTGHAPRLELQHSC